MKVRVTKMLDDVIVGSEESFDNSFVVSDKDIGSRLDSFVSSSF